MYNLAILFSAKAMKRYQWSLFNWLIKIYPEKIYLSIVMNGYKIWKYIIKKTKIDFSF